MKLNLEARRKLRLILYNLEWVCTLRRRVRVTDTVETKLKLIRGGWVTDRGDTRRQGSSGDMICFSRSAQRASHGE